jgi:aminoglycoside phosphotransferase (APT) family kinase protein
MTAPAVSPDIGDTDRLAAWMDASGLASGAPLEHRSISLGSQNEIYEIRRGDLHCAMRVPPSGAPADRDNGIMREWQIIAALDGTDVPHPAAVAVCTDTSVLGRPFYLTGFVDGWSPMQTMGRWPPPFDTDIKARRGLAYQLIEGAAQMARLDWRARGLSGLGRPDGFHERQVDRWTSFLNRIKGRELPGFDEAAAWLRSHKPIDYVPGLMHGDYQFANVMYRDGAPARLAAIVDWEMGTVGDPKLDLAWVVHAWPEEPGGERTAGGGGSGGGEGSVGGYADITGMPSRTQLLERYAEVSGRQVDDIDYYCILAKWKLAIVLEQGYQRAGNDAKLLSFGPLILEAMRGAAELAAVSDYRLVRPA